jgi:hypothetical protein
MWEGPRLVKVFQRPFKGLLKAFEKPYEGLLGRKAFYVKAPG